MMIGGETEIIERLDPIFATLAPGMGEFPRTVGREKIDGTAEHGYLHCGPNGAGHFVKMVHNGMESGIMAAYAEGLAILRSANVGKQANGAADTETTPLRDPEHYQYDLEPGRYCGSVAPRKCDCILVARPDSQRTTAGSESVEVCRPCV
jgi:6-phosphogluconate dehydrogenase